MTSSISRPAPLSARWFALAVAGGAALLVPAAGVVHAVQGWQRENVAEELQHLQGALSAAAPHPTIDQGSFVEHLPWTAFTTRVIGEAQRAAAAQNVGFGAVSISEQPATDKALGHTTISFTLRGSYPHIKDTLAAVAERFPAMAVKQVSLRRAGAPAEVDARVDVLLATQPLAGSAAAGP